CDLPLGEEGRVRPGAGVQQSPQERGGEVERDVADYHRVVKRVVEGIGAFHRDIGQLPGEAARAVLVELDGGASTPQLRQGCGQGAVAGTDLQDRTVGAADKVDDEGDGGGVGEEVLAEFVSAAVD